MTRSAPTSPGSTPLLDREAEADLAKRYAAAREAQRLGHAGDSPHALAEVVKGR